MISVTSKLQDVNTTTCFAPNFDMSLITSPWQRNDIGKAEVAKRLTCAYVYSPVFALAAATA